MWWQRQTFVSRTKFQPFNPQRVTLIIELFRLTVLSGYDELHLAWMKEIFRMQLLGNWGNGNKIFTLYLEKWIVDRQINKNGSVRCIQNMLMAFLVTGIAHECACTSHCCNNLFDLHLSCILLSAVPTWSLCLPHALKQSNDLIFVGWKCKRCGNPSKTINTEQWEYIAAAKCVRKDWYVQQSTNNSSQTCKTASPYQCYIQDGKGWFPLG
jgi:hypothetical protein